MKCVREKDRAQDPSSSLPIFHLYLTTQVMNKLHDLQVLIAVIKLNLLNVKFWILFGQQHRKRGDPSSTVHLRASYEYKNYSYLVLQRKKRQSKTQVLIIAQPPTASAAQMGSLFKCRLVILQFLFLFQQMHMHLPYVTRGR